MMRIPRIACVRAPDFSLTWWLARHPEYAASPVVLAEGRKAGAPVVAANATARAYDVRPGLSVSQARARAPALHVHVRDPDAEHDLSRQIVTRLQSLTPSVEEESPGLWFLESLGKGRLYGGERPFIKRVFSALDPWGLPVCIGLADNRAVARVAAQVASVRSFVIVPPGRERKFLAALPSEHTAMPELAPYLHALGLSTMQQVAELPASQWAARFGRSGVKLQELARGLEGSPFAPEKLSEPLQRAEAYDFPLFSSPTLVERTETLLALLLSTLSSRQQAAHTVCVDFDLEDGSKSSRELSLAQPSCISTPFARQLAQKLKEQALRAGVRGVVVRIESVSAAPVEQLEWSRRPARVVPRELPHRSGEWRVPRALSAPLPEAAAEWRPVDAPTPRAELPLADASVELACLSSPSGLRLFSPPQRVNAVWAGDVLSKLEGPSLQQRVQTCRGPWVVSGHWWRTPFHRLYYEVNTAGGCYLVYYDRATGHWYVQGLFD